MKICMSCDCEFTSDIWECPCCNFAPVRVNEIFSFAPELARQNSGFRPEIFSELVVLEARSFWFRSRNKLIVWALRKYFPNAKNFLEIGCGTGFVLSGISSACPSVELAGSEIFNEGLDLAKKRLPDAKLLQMDAQYIPFKEEFDVIGAFDVLEHIEDDKTVLSQMHRATTFGGGIILTVPQHEFLWSEQDEHACHVRRYLKEDLTRKVVEAGFTVERSTSFVSLLLPVMALSRRRNKESNADYEPLSELRICRIANALLLGVMGIERILIRFGVSMPIGGSLLLVARKY